MIRRVIPKGTPLEPYSQEDISLMMDHVNSYGREIINDRTPYHMFEFLYGKDGLRKLGANLIPHDEIVLRPTLLKKN